MRLLRNLADAVAALDFDVNSFQKLESGRFRIDILLDGERPKRPGKGRRIKRLVQLDYAAIANKLQSAKSMQDGAGILDAIAPTKLELEQISRLLMLPINSKDRIEQMRQRVLEATIGFRLRSQAIRGE